MGILYHFPMSVFSRRARLALAHKGFDVELRDGRADEAHLAEARRLFPLGTMPVLVDDGRVVGDSGAIAHYLDVRYPDRPMLWPSGPNAAQEAFMIANAVDAAMNTVVDLGTRYWELHGDPSWAPVVRERVGRAQAAMELVAAKATRPTLAGDSWGAADIWALSATLWVSKWPERAPTSPAVAHMLTLGFQLPAALVAWAKQHQSRPEVRAIYE
jgi:glutathione S-transferase